MDSARGNSNYALEKLRELLASDHVASDGKLPTERALSERLGVSRRAIRRALEVLETEGRIWRRQGAGTFAGMKPDDWGERLDAIVAGTDFMEIMEVRLRVEPQLAQLAAMRAKPSDTERMYDLVEKIGKSTDADGRELWDGALHRAVAQCAGNHFFLAIFDVINRVRQDDAWQTIRERARNVGGTRPVTRSQHLAIVDAIAARDPAQAGEAMRQHLLTLQESLIRITSLDRSETRTEEETGQGMTL